MNDYTQWRYKPYLIDGPHIGGVLAIVEGIRPRDRRTFYVSAYDDGDGGLYVDVSAARDVRIRITEEPDSEGEIVFTAREGSSRT